MKSTSIVHFSDMIQYTSPLRLLSSTEAFSLLKYNLKAYSRFPQVQIQGCRTNEK